MSKQHSRKVQAYGYTFDSQTEFLRYVDLLAMEAEGAITGLVVHPLFELKPRIVVKANGVHDGYVQSRETYTADFLYTWNGYIVVEDVKFLQKKTNKPFVQTPARNKHKALLAIWDEQKALDVKNLILVCQTGNGWLYFNSNSKPIQSLTFCRKVEVAA